MNIGVGLPTSTSGISGQLLVDWAKRADAGPFSSLGVVDRVAYQNYEPFTALAAAAAVTQRVRLATMVVIAPLRNTAILAKQAASVHAISDGRVTLGLAVGARGEDYAVSGVDSRGRGRRFGEQLEAIRDIWEGGTIGPTPATPGPQLLVGGSSGEALARMADHVGDGVFRARRWERGRRGRVPEALLRVHGTVRRENRGRKSDLPRRDQRLHPRLRRCGLRRAGSVSHGFQHRPGGTTGRGDRLKGALRRHRRRTLGTVLRAAGQEGQPE